MTAAPQEAATPRFPRLAVAFGIAAMLLIAVTSLGTGWFVSERIRTISQSQIVVLGASAELADGSEQRELALRAFAATGDPALRARYRALTGRLSSALDRLQHAIVLDANRRSFHDVRIAERRAQAFEQAALQAAARRETATALTLLADTEYRRSLARYRAGLGIIQARSRAYVESSRAEADRTLVAGMFANVLGLALLAGTGFLILRPVRAWGRQLAQAQREAAAAAEAKGQFVAVMSHEIRTPLNAVIGFADLLQSDRDLTEAQRRQVSLIQGAGSMLLTVVNDILDFSKLEAGMIALEPRPFAITMLVDNCVSILRPAADSKTLTLDVRIAPSLQGAFLGDEDRLRQVLLNLLNNAVKFTERGGVTLTVAEDDGLVTFAVTDTGIGIPADRQADLFQPFTQSDASISRRFGGTGLGLSISRQLVEAMGGAIRVDSADGQGSTFAFAVPLARTAMPVPQRADDNATPDGVAILLAEDLAMNRELAVAILSAAGHRVRVAEDGQQAVAKAAEEVFDLVLMDIQMPVMDGISAARAIRQLPAPHGNVPIVAMTANAMPDQVDRYRQAGMNGHVAKPIRQQELHAAIARLARPGGPCREVRADDNDGARPAFDPARLQKVQAMIPADRLAAHVGRLCDQAGEAAAHAARGDWDQCRPLAHNVASQAGMLGLAALETAARDLEEACDRGAASAGHARTFEQARSAAFALPAIAALRGAA